MTMKRGGMFYEISFFFVVVYAFVSKWVADPRVCLIALGALALAAIYELLYILFLGQKDFVSFGRALAIAGFYLSLDVLILALTYFCIEFYFGSTVAGLFSLNGFFEFYSIPIVINTPYLGAIPIAVSILYMLIYTIVTKRKYLRSSY